MNTSRFIHLKELAADPAIELSTKTVLKKLRLLGLEECRDKLSKKPIRFHRAAARAALLAKGYEVEF
jgi:hypothetical protein